MRRIQQTAILATLSLAAACSGEPTTWGEVAEEIAHAVCWKTYDCGQHEDYDLCNAHEVSHLCGLDDNCGEPVQGSVDTLTFQCTWAIYDAECAEEFEWPGNCVHAFKHLRPRVGS